MPLRKTPLTRRRLASLLFAGAADPLGALRWSLAEVRRALGESVVNGDPVCFARPENVRMSAALRVIGGLGRAMGVVRRRGRSVVWAGRPSSPEK